jgi:hypothetical protein
MHVLALLILMSNCTSAEQRVSDFAVRLRDNVISGDIDQFRRIPCYPAPCIDDDDVTHVFGDPAVESYVRTLLRKPSTRIRIFGPYTYSDELRDRSYAIMFYDPDVVEFDHEGNLSARQREEFWWNGYVETVVSPVGGEWGFHRTPFYHGADPPWVEDF